MIVVHPGLYMDGQARLVSDVIVDVPDHSFAIVFLNLSFARLFRQCVLVSASMKILNC